MIPCLILYVEAQPLAVPFEFGADDGFDPRLGSRLGEFHRAMQVALVGQGDCGKLVALGQANYGVNRERGVQKGVTTVDVERNVAGCASYRCDATRGYPSLNPKPEFRAGGGADDLPRSCFRRQAGGGMTQTLPLHNGKLVGCRPVGSCGRSNAEDKIVSAQDYATAILFAQCIHHISQALLGLVLPGGAIQGEQASEAPVIEIRELE